MNVTLSLDDELVEKVNKIAMDQETTLTGMVRAYLEGLATEPSEAEVKRRQHELLHETFDQIRFKLEDKNWTRDDLYDDRS